MARLSILLATLIMFISGLRSQTIVITFEGTLNGSPIPLDSILVMNLTQGGDTTIYFPNNVLVLGTTGLSEQVGSAPVFVVLPNPFEASTEVHVVTVAMGDLLLMVHDASGRQVALLHTAGGIGVHRFRFTALTNGVYVMSVTQGGQRRTRRMVATEGSGNAVDLRYLGAGAIGGKAKSDRSAFMWEAGDELRYIGYATDAAIVNSAAIDEVPVVTATRTFTMNAGRVCPESPTVMDIDGNVYPVVRIGDQCWMAANLRTTRYRDGTIIPNVTGNTAWTQLNSGAWSNYNNSPGNDASYGKLYNWYAAANPNICPQGWHVPTDAEWQQLESALGMPGSELVQTGYRGASQNVGGKMKTTTLWVSPNTGATNESGFSGLPGGGRDGNGGNFYNLGSSVGWWSASGSGAEDAWGRFLANGSAGVSRYYYLKRNGFCLRCVRD